MHFRSIFFHVEEFPIILSRTFWESFATRRRGLPNHASGTCCDECNDDNHNSDPTLDALVLTQQGSIRKRRLYLSLSCKIEIQAIDL